MRQRDVVEGSLRSYSDGMKREHGVRLDGADAVAAPATVSGELSANCDHWETGKVRQTALTREPGDLPSAVPGLMGERGCSHIVGMFHRSSPKALTRVLVARLRREECPAHRMMRAPDAPL